MHPLKLKIIDYCNSLPFTEETFPFDTKTWVGKVHGKMFALMDVLSEDVRINLKSDPEKAVQLRAEYENIIPGYHMNKKHWNTVICDQRPMGWNFIKELLDDSYGLVLNSIPKKIRTTEIKE